MKLGIDQKALIAGLAAGAGGSFAQGLPVLGRFGPAVGLAVGASLLGDASTRKTGQFLAGVAAGSALLQGAGVGASGGFL